MSRRGNEFGDVEPRAFARAEPTTTIGLREHLAFMLANPERFTGSEDITIELPATDYLRILAATVADNEGSISAWVVEAVRQRLRGLE